jgi:hypothetical protein
MNNGLIQLLPSQGKVGTHCLVASTTDNFLGSTRPEKLNRYLKLHNVRFFKDGKQVHALSPDLHLANSISLTFEVQKNQEKFDTVTHGSTSHEFLCSVEQWAAVVNHNLSYLAATMDTSV